MTEQEIFEKYSKKWTKLIQESLRKNKRVATGKTLRSVKPRIQPSGFQIVGGKHIENIIKGRGRSKTSGGSGWLNELREWARARGIPQGFVYAIYVNINKRGWKTPPTPNLITSVITDSEIRLLIRDLGKIQLSLAKETLLKSINK